MERIKQKQSKGYMIVDYGLCAKYGPNLTNFICNLVNKYYYWQKNNENFNGSFFITHADQTGQIGLSGKQIRRCKEQAKLNGWIRTYYDGYPKKEWYIINMQSPDIQSLIPFCNPHSLQKVTFIGDKREPLINSSVPKSNELVCEEEKTHTQNSFSCAEEVFKPEAINEDSESSPSKDTGTLKNSSSVIPTLAGVQKYGQETGKDSQEVIKFYNWATSRNWHNTVGRNIITTWKDSLDYWCSIAFKKQQDAFITVNNGTMTEGEYALMHEPKKFNRPIRTTYEMSEARKRDFKEQYPDFDFNHNDISQYTEVLNRDTGKMELKLIMP